MMFRFLKKRKEKKEITLYETMILPVVEMSPFGNETLELPSTLRLRRLDALYVVLPLFTMPMIMDGVVSLKRRKEP